MTIQKALSVLGMVVASVLPSAMMAESSLELLSPPKEGQQHSTARSLAEGDFDDFNELFKNARINLPNADVSRSGLTLRIRNLYCQDMAVGDILTSVNRIGDNIKFSLQVNPFTMDCYADYSYSYLFFRGSGRVEARTRNNRAEVQLNWPVRVGADGTYYPPPTQTDVEQCASSLDIYEMNFDGGLVSAILEVFENIIKDVLEDEVGGIVCQELVKLPQQFDPYLESFAARLLSYVQPIPAALSNPLSTELTFKANTAADLNLINYLGEPGTVDGAFDRILQQIDSLLAGTVSDPNSPTGTGRDLSVNVLMRDNLLNEDGALVLDVASLWDENVIFEGDDRLTKSTISLDAVKVFGLDTLRDVRPLDNIGDYTLQSEFRWNYLDIEADLTVTIQPSDREDSFLINPNPVTIVEPIKVFFGVDDLVTKLSLFLPIDKDQLGLLEVGSLLERDNLVGCMLSIVHDMEVAGMDVSIANIEDPVLQGFVAPGIDRVVSSMVKAAFFMFEPTILRAVPYGFESLVRDFVNNRVVDAFISNPERTDCPTVTSTSRYIDFRDLLLGPGVAGTFGGSGTEPYGDLGHVAYAFVDDMLSTSGSDGSPSINDMIIRPFTKRQSGVEGALRFSSTLFSAVADDITNPFLSSFFDKVQFNISDVRITNLDTFVKPLSLMRPVIGKANTVENVVKIGFPTRAPEATLRFLLAVEGESSFLNMLNEFDIIVEVDSLYLYSKLEVLLVASAFLGIRIEDILSLDCWLAALEGAELDDQGYLANTNGTVLRGVTVETINSIIEGFSLQVRCVACLNPATSVLPAIRAILEDSGAMGVFQTRIAALVVSALQSTSFETLISRRVYQATRSCPSSETYDQDFVSPDFAPIPLPVVSDDAVDTVLFTGVLAGWIGVVVFAENQSLKAGAEGKTSDPLSAERSFVAPSGMRLLDWTDLGGSTGFGRLANLALGFARNFLNQTNSDGDLAINSILHDFLGESFERNLGLDFTLDGLGISIGEVRATGLDSFERLDLFEPIGPKTLRNRLQMSSIQVELDVSAGYESNPQQVSLAFTVKDIVLDISVFTAIDVDKIRELNLGSLLGTSNILPCILSTAYEVSITQANVNVGSFDGPSVVGLMPDTSEVLDQSFADINERFGTQLLDAVPIVFDGILRDVSSELLNLFVKGTACPRPAAVDADDLVDFRDLFKLVGPGLIGDVPPMLLDYADSNLFKASDGNSLAPINDVVIAPITKAQSGEDGVISLDHTVFNVIAGGASSSRFGIDSITFAGFEPRVENIDTIQSPAIFMEPNIADPNLLGNRFVVGSEVKPLRLALKTKLEVRGIEELSMINDMSIFIEMIGLNVVADILARVGLKELLTMPLGNSTSLHCWLATLQVPALDEGVKMPAEETAALAFDVFELALSSLHLRASCSGPHACSSIGLAEVSKVFETMESKGVASIFNQALVEIIVDIVDSVFFQAFLHRMILVSKSQCLGASVPFTDDLVDLPPLPQPSLESMENLRFLIGYGISVAWIVGAESHVTYLMGETPPAANFSLPTGPPFIDFTDLSNTIAPWAEKLLLEASTFLGESVSKTESETAELRISSLVRWFLPPDRVLSISLNEARFGNEDLGLSIDAIRVKGLDTFTNAKVLEITGPQTMRNVFSWENLSVELDLVLGPENPSAIQKRFGTTTISLELSKVEMAVSILLGINQFTLGGLDLGQLLYVEALLPCLLSSAQVVALTELNVTTASIEKFEIFGFNLPQTVEAAEQLERVMLEDYGDVLTASITPMFDVTLKAMLNHWMQDFSSAKVACPRIPMQPGSTGLVDFRDLLLPREEAAKYGATGNAPYGDLFSRALEAVNRELLLIDPALGVPRINSLIVAPLTAARSGIPGTLVFPGNLFNTQAKVDVGGLRAKILLRAYDAYIENLDTVGLPLSVMNPVAGEPHHINNTATLGVGRSFKFGTRFRIELIGDDTEIRNDLDISIGLDAATLALTALAKVPEEAFMNFPARDLLNLNCWLAMLPPPRLDAYGVRVGGSEPSLSILNIAANVPRASLNISCIDCTSPDLINISELMTSDESVEEMTTVLKRVLNYFGNTLGDEFLQVFLDRRVNEARLKCPHSPEYSPRQEILFQAFEEPDKGGSSLQVLLTLTIVAAATIGCICVLAMITKMIVMRRHRHWIRSLPGDHVSSLWKKQLREEEKEAAMNNSSDSMFRSSDIPSHVRTCMPLVILGNIAFFLSGHLNLGASVSVLISLGGQTYTANNFFEFSMARSTIEMWEAGAKELAIMLFIFSGVWPYTKQLMSLALWFLPPNRVSISKRGKIFLWLDVLAKWSMIDIFVLVITLAAFRVSVQSPDVGFLPPGFYSIDLLVIPKWGLYANMIAQLISQVSSHFIIHYHRMIAEKASYEFEATQQLESRRAGDGDIVTGEEPNSACRTKLHEHAFRRPHSGENGTLVVRTGTGALLLATSAALCTLVAVGCIVSSFSLDVLGLIGLLVESGQEFNDAYTEVGVFSLVGLLFDQAEFTGKTRDYIGLGSFSVLLLCTVLLVPLLQTAALIYNWFASLSRKERTKISVIVEILQAWQYSEVYLLSLVIASWQLAPVSDFMVNDYCGALTNTFSAMAFYGLIEANDAQCFRVEPSIESGFYLIALGAVLLALLNSFVTKATTQYFRDTSQGERCKPNEQQDTVSASKNEIAEMKAYIQPVPVLFTDTYRWFLCGESGATGSLPGEISVLVDNDNALGRANGQDYNFDTTVDVDEERRPWVPQ